jgi:hypothetical protein
MKKGTVKTLIISIVLYALMVLWIVNGVHLDPEDKILICFLGLFCIGLPTLIREIGDF